MNIINFLTHTYGKLAVLDILIIVVYMLLCLYIGFRKAGKIHNIKDFALGREHISTAMLIATIYATHLGAGATFGTIEKVYSMGLVFALGLLSSPLRWLCSIWLVNNNIERFKGCLSLSHIMHRLYGPAGLWGTNIVSIFGTIATTSAQASAIGYLLHYFMSLPISLGIILGISVLTLYSTLGGIRAVIITDMMQFIVFYVAIPLLCAFGLYKLGGYTAFIESLPHSKTSISLDYDSFSLISGLFVFTIMDIGGTPFIQRFLMSGDSRQLVKALKSVLCIDFFMTLVIIILGFIMMSILPSSINPRIAFLEMVHEFVPIGILGVIVVGLIAVIMSTADSFLNTGSILCAHDIGRGLFPKMSDRTEVLLARLSTILISIASVTLALRGNSVIELIWMASNIYNPVVFIPMTAGFFGFSTNGKSFIISTLCAVIATLLGAHIQGMFDLVSLMFGLTGSALGLFGAHYIQIYLGILERRKTPRPKKTSFSLSRHITNLIRSLSKINLKTVLTKINRSITQDPPNYYAFAIWGMVYCLYPLLLLIAAGDSNVIHSYSLESVLRMIGAIGCVVLLFHEMWIERLKDKYLGLYWYILLLWCLPMLGTYGLILRYNDWVWIIHLLMAFFILSAFANYRAAILMAILGSVIGFTLSCLDFSNSALLDSPIIANKLNDTIIALLYLTMALGISREIIWKMQNNLALSTTDALTLLHNKRYLNMNLENIIEDAYTEDLPLSLIMIDMDYFGAINKNYGHQSGDAVLKELDRRIKQNMWPTDICARYGGEEFIIITPNTTLEEARKVAERLLDIIRSTPFNIPAKPKAINCTASIGVAILKAGENVESLITRADSALKRAKSKGRNKVEEILDEV